MRKTSAAITTSTSAATTSTSMYSSYPRAPFPTPAVRPGSPGRSSAAACARGVDPRGVDHARQGERGDGDETAGEPDLREAQGEARGPDKVVPQQLDRDGERAERCDAPGDHQRVGEHASGAPRRTTRREARPRGH